MRTVAQQRPAGWLTRGEEIVEAICSPRRKGRSRREWRAMDRGAESDNRDQPPLSPFRASEVAQFSLFVHHSF